MKRRKVLQPNQRFYEGVLKYQRIDGLWALGLFCIISALYGLLAVVERKYPVVRENTIFFGCALNLLMIAIAILLIKARGENLSSIGLCGGNWRQSCAAGLVLACVLFFNNCLSHIIGGASFVSIENICKLSIYYLTVALCEEIVFRGYIATRLYGLVKNPYVVIVLSGVLFVVMHFPYRMIAYGRTISELTIHNVGWIFDLFVTHVVLSFLYWKTNSLYGAIIPHWISNLAYNLVAR